jgi:hypothetical protein
MKKDFSERIVKANAVQHGETSLEQDKRYFSELIQIDFWGHGSPISIRAGSIASSAPSCHGKNADRRSFQFGRMQEKKKI